LQSLRINNNNGNIAACVVRSTMAMAYQQHMASKMVAK